MLELAFRHRGVAQVCVRVVDRFLRHLATEVAERQDLEGLALEFGHVFSERLRGRMNPGMCVIRHTMELQHHDPVRCTVENAPEKVERPAGNGIAGRRDEQPIVALWIISRTRFERPVVEFGRQPPACEPITEIPELAQGLQTKVIAAPSKANGFGNAYSFECVLDQGQFPFQPCSVLGLGEVRVRPGVVANLETHLRDFCDLIPGHEVCAVVHPPMRHEKRGGKT